MRVDVLPGKWCWTDKPSCRTPSPCLLGYQASRSKFPCGYSRDDTRGETCRECVGMIRVQICIICRCTCSECNMPSMYSLQLMCVFLQEGLLDADHHVAVALGPADQPGPAVRTLLHSLSSISSWLRKHPKLSIQVQKPICCSDTKDYTDRPDGPI